MGSIPATSAISDNRVALVLMQPLEQHAALYSELAPLIDAGETEGIISLLARYYREELDPAALFSILIRIGAKNYSFENFKEQVPHALFGTCACHSLAKHLNHEQAMLLMLQAAVYLAHDSKLHELHEVKPELDTETEEPEELGAALVEAVIQADLPRADGALEALQRMPGARQALANSFFHAASLDHKHLGHKLIMATLLFEALVELGGEIAFGILRPAVHYAANEVRSDARERIGDWVEEIDLEEATLLGHRRELTLREVEALAREILHGGYRRAVNHILRNECSLNSFLDALSVAASEWVRQDFEHPVVAIHRFTYVHAARVALSHMDKFALWPLLNAVELLHEDWKGEEFAPMELSVEFTGPKEVAGWAANQDAEPTAMHVHKFAYAFLAENRAVADDLKPFLHRAYFALRERVPDSQKIREAFADAAG